MTHYDDCIYISQCGIYPDYRSIQPDFIFDMLVTKRTNVFSVGLQPVS